MTLEEFFNLRDRIFAARKSGILEKHQEERAFFDLRLWEKRG